jgi:hypothetical protein
MESECLLPWINNCETVKLVIIVGDQKYRIAASKASHKQCVGTYMDPFSQRLALFQKSVHI